MRAFYSIFPKLFLSFLSLSAFPLALLGYLTYQNISNTLNEKLNEDAFSILHQKSIALSSYMKDLERMGNAIAASPTVSDFLKNTSEVNYPSFFRKLDELIDSIHLIRPENIGITIISNHQFVYYYGYSYNKNFTGFDHYDWFARPTGTRNTPFISTFHTRPYSNYEPEQTVFSYVKDLSSLNLKATGTLIIDFRIDLLNHLFGPASESADLTVRDNEFGIYIKNQQGHILYPYQSELSISSVLKWDDPQKYKLIEHQDQSTGWTITAYFPKDKLYEPLYKIQKSTVYVIVLGAFVCLIASLYISRKISNPIRKLTKLMKRVGQGDFNTYSKIQRKDEIGALSIGFNYMVNRIRDLIELVYMEQQDKQKAEVAALQSQIKPHFIYNTLEIINAMARKKQEMEISKLIVLLGKLLRMSISTFDNVILISKELEYVTYYLEIHKFRQQNFDYEMNVDPAISNLFTIKWIIQPIVENAIIHGIDPKREGGKIEISGWLEDEDVIIQVKDNGVGMKHDDLQLIQFNLDQHSEQFTKHFNKVGLFNVQSRIRMHYGKPYGIQIEGMQGEGIVVKIRLPRRTTNESL